MGRWKSRWRALPSIGLGVAVVPLLGLFAGLSYPLAADEARAAAARLDPPPAVAEAPIARRSLAASIGREVERMGARGPFRVPSKAALDAWEGTTRAMLEGGCEELALPDALEGYGLRRFTDERTGRELCALEEAPGGALGWGTFVTRRGPARKVHLLVPHPVHDTHTPAQAVDLFLGAGARSALFAGAGRDAAPLGSGCGDRAASDPAHSPRTMFQPTVAALMKVGPADLVLELHGMASRSCAGVDVYITHGSATTPEPGDVLWALREGLARSRPGWTVAVPGADAPRCRLHGSENVQGRLLSGVPCDDVCERAPSRPSPTFVHVEQKPWARDAQAWVAALEGVLGSEP